MNKVIITLAMIISAYGLIYKYSQINDEIASFKSFVPQGDINSAKYSTDVDSVKDIFKIHQYPSYRKVSKTIQKKPSIIFPRIEVKTIFMGGNPVAQIKLNGKTIMVKKGTQNSGITVLDVNSDGIKVSYKGNEKYFYK